MIEKWKIEYFFKWKVKYFFKRIYWKLTRVLFKYIPFIVKCEECEKQFIISYLERDFDKGMENYCNSIPIYQCKKCKNNQ